MDKERSAPEDASSPPVDGPSPGESGEEKEETSASSSDKPERDEDDS